MHRTPGSRSLGNRVCGVPWKQFAGVRVAWSLALVCLCSFFASVLLADDQRIDPKLRASLCAFCGSETFACGSNMALLNAQENQSSLSAAPNLTTSLSAAHSLNAKVQQILLQLNRDRQILNESNCTCIPLSWRCDGQADCGDLSDEIGCGNSTCSTMEFSCATNSRCIPKQKFCNGESDNSDEIDCTPRQCNMELETRCDNGRCILSDWLCDGENDCGDLSDERCVNACTSDEFQCHSGECIPLANYCNNETDCADGLSDEVDCHFKAFSSTSTSSVHVSCPTSQFMCNNGLCISKLYQCDEDNDCGDMSDELACEGQTRCEGNDCANGHQTTLLAPDKQTCANDQFQCRSGMCIQMDLKCDGNEDCGDGSDEEECANNNNECTGGNFRCRDGTCVSLWHICDGQPNCPDGSDEDTNSTCVPGITPCRENGFPCQHLCVATASDHFCACKEGYRKGNDGRSCIDIDECQSGNLKSELDYQWLTDSPKEHLIASVQVCSQLCANSVPGFQCSCVKGYRLAADKRKCKAIEGPQPLMIATAHSHQFSVFTLDFMTDKLDEKTTPPPESKTAFSHKLTIAFDYAYSKQLLFWSDPRTHQIFRALFKLNKSSNLNFLQQSPLELYQIRPIIQSGLVLLSGLSVDWINNRLYWTDAGTSQIEFCNFDGLDRKILFRQYIQKPHSIVTHPEKSQIFWSDWGEPVRIESAFMDGSGRQVIVSSFLGLPSGLTIDYPASKLYWTDVKQSVIECSNLDGSGRFIIVHDQVLSPVSLAIFEDNLYWSSFNNSLQIQSVSKLTGNNRLTLSVPSLEPSELNLEVKIFHPLRQPFVEGSPCTSHPCSHLCLPNNISFRCSCPFGYSFEDSAHHKCQLSSNSLLLFTHRNDIRAVRVAKKHFIPETDPLYNDYNLAHVLPIGYISFVVSFDYDPYSSTIFWADIVNKSIGRAKLTEQQETIISGSLEAPSGIAFDWATSSIYFCDTSRNVIEVAKMNGAFRSLLVWRSLDQPRDIVLDPVSGFMFWSQWSNSTSNIERAAMDGSYRIILHALNLTKPHGLALDHLYKRLYWADSGRAVIECSFYDGSDRRTVISKNVQHPFAVAIAGDLIYFSDLHQRNIQQANKITGEMQNIVYENADALMDITVLQHNRSVLSQEFAATNVCQRAKCSHLCLLSPMQPGYRCFCPTGIILGADGHTCAHDMNKYLIFTTRKAIRRISLETEHHMDVSIAFDRPLENAFVLDVHSHSKTVFWTDTNENIIYRANMLTGQTEAVVRFGLLDPNGLAVDSVGEKLFWTDAGRKRIEVAKFDGTQRKALVSQDLDSPRAIALNHQTGHMVWADWGAQVRIERADMDGSKRAILVNHDLGWPNGITITKSGRIIWADSKTHTIEMVDMNGANRRNIVEDLASPYGITIMDNYLYFTDWHSKTIHRVYLSDSELSSNVQIMPAKLEIFAKSLPNIVDIRAVDQHEEDLAFEEQHNMCQINNGGCSHLCLRNSDPGYSCRCPTGMILLDDAKTCKIEITKQLLVACKNSLRIISLESADLGDTYLPVDNLIDVVSVDFHFSHGLIFYIDRALNQILSLKINTSLSQLSTVTSLTPQIVISTELVQPNSLAVDWIGDNLYFSDQERHLIEVARLDGSSRKILIDLDLEGPKCLLVLPSAGFIFWINSGLQQRIERAFLDGSGRLTLVNTDIGQLNGLTVDSSSAENGGIERIYWTDGGMSRIESARIDGTDRQSVLTKGLTLPHSVAVLNEFLFWTDAYNKAIEQANRWSADNYHLIADNVDSLSDIKVISAWSQGDFQTTNESTKNSNPCAQDNGACSHLCLFRPHGYICACPSYPEKRPCSTVPGEIVSSVTVAREIKEGDQEKSILLNSKSAATEATPRWNFDKPDEPDDTTQANESLSRKEVAELCRGNSTLAKCNSSRFSFANEHIVQITYVLALILLSLAVLVCSILVFICKRRLMEEEVKSSIKMESNPQAMQLYNNSIVPIASAKSLHMNPFTQSVFDQSVYGRGDGYQFIDNVPPPPPPPRRLMETNASVDYELFKPFDLRLSPLSIDQLGRAQMGHNNSQSRRAPPPWAQSLPRHSATGINNQHSRSAFNSPYVTTKSSHNKRQQQHPQINYLCLESSRLETDI